MLSFRAVVVGAILVVAAVGSAAVQEEKPETNLVGGLTFLDQVEVTIVNIDVFVRDKNQQAVTDLTIGDFEVLHDGRRRELTNFLYIDESLRPMAGKLNAPPEPGAEPADAEPEIKPIHLVVYVDNENLRPFERNQVLGHVRRFLQATVRPGVEAMIVSYQGSVKVVQDFTSNPRELADALRGLRRLTGGRVSRDSEHSTLAGEIDRLRGVEGNLAGGSRLTEDGSLLYDRLVTYAESVSMDTVRDLRAVDSLGATLTGLPGRKYLVYVSSGLPMVPGKDLFFEFSQLYQGVAYNSLLARFDQQRAYRSLAASANAQGVTFYTIDARGLASDSSKSAERAALSDPMAGMIGEMNSSEPLAYLAQRTGGLAVIGTNNFGDALERVRQDLFSYYSIGYPINAAGGDRVHRIEVRLPNHSELKLRYRRAIVEKSRESQVRDTVMSALLFEIDENPMGIRASVDRAKPVQEGRWLLPLRIAIPTASVALLPQGDTLVGQVVAFVCLRGDNWGQSDLQRYEQSIRVPRAQYELLADRDMTIELQLLIEPGHYRVSVGLLDPITRQASYQTLPASTPKD